MRTRNLLFLLSLLGAEVLAYSSTQSHDFDIEPYSRKLVKHHKSVWYGLMGSGDTGIMCINLTTSAKAELLLGSCQKVFSLGHFETGHISMNRSVVERGLKLARGDSDCHHTLINMHIRSHDEAIYGQVNFFKCREEVTFPEPQNKFGEVVTELKPVEINSADLYQEFPFNHANGDVVVNSLKMRNTVDAMVYSKDFTVCFKLLDAPFAKVTLSKCAGTNDLVLLLNRDTTVGLSFEARSKFLNLAGEKCDDREGEHEWYMKTEGSFGKDVVSGAVSVFPCKHEVTRQDGARYDTFKPNFMQDRSQNTFHFSLEAHHHGVYSATLKEMLDRATYNKAAMMQIKVNIETTGPVSVAVSRCKTHVEDEKIYIAENQDAGTIYINHSKLKDLQKLTMRPVCGPLESEEGLWLYIKAHDSDARGRMVISLEQPDTENRIFNLALTNLFTIRANGTIKRQAHLEHTFDDALQTNRFIGIDLKTSKNITLSMSKCMNSPKQILAENVGTGLHYYRIQAIIKMYYLIKNTICPERENSGYGNVVFHITAVGGEATGEMQFVRLFKHKAPEGHIVSVGPIDDMEYARRATFDRANLSVSIDNIQDKTPAEVDIRFYVEHALRNPRINFVIDTDSKKPVTIKLSKFSDPEEKGFSVTVDEKRVVPLQELLELQVLIKSALKNNTARYGLFVHVLDKSFNGSVTFYTLDFHYEHMQDMGYYNVGLGKSYISGVDMHSFDRAVVIEVSNWQKHPMTVTVSMCNAEKGKKVIEGQFVTQASVRIEPMMLYELYNMCPQKDGASILFVQIQSDSAEGLINIDKRPDEEWKLECQGWACRAPTQIYYSKKQEKTMRSLY
ncbi:unnamed protein product [Caenorhabditis sp. 36 PRJEB53466]|nr:unnamed protein product [Caenorhabditis sp. 36 PRJEB53466]